MKKKLILSMLCLLLALSPMAQLAAADTPAGVMHLENDYVDVLIHGDNGRFSIRTKIGHPLRDGDNNQPLLYNRKEPDTSFTTFRIDGRDYIYGNDYGFLGSDGRFVYDPVSQGLTNQSVWRVKDVEIIQTITLYTQKENPNLGNVKITYEATNRSDRPVEVGSRILLDTMMGPEDASPFSLSGSTQFIHTETEIANPEHYYWRAVDNPIAPKVIAYGFLRGWGNDAPDRIVAAHWEGISRTKWEYTVDPTLEFTSNRNKYGTADSAFALYWNPETLAPGATKVFETFYGLGSFTTSLKQARYASQVIAPKELMLNDARDGYVEDEFDVRLEVDNTTSKAEPLRNVRVEIGLPAELELAEGERTVKTIPAVAVNETTTVTWRVKAKPQYTYKAAQYWVSVQAEGGEEVVHPGYVVMPALSGKLPDVQILEVLPSTMYVHNEDKSVYVKGVGLDAFRGNFGIELTLVRERDGRTFRIEDVDVISDSQMLLDLGEALQGSTPEAGLYRLEIDAREFGSFTKTIEFTEDTKYKSRSYGILTVIGEDSTYSIVPVENEAELAALKSSGEDVLLEIRGEIREIVSGSAKLYRVNPGATINSVVRYDAHPTVSNRYQVVQELAVEKKAKDLTHTGDYVAVTGYGSLSIPNFPFVIGNFTIELVDGEEYSLDPDDDQKPVAIEWDDLKWLTLIQQIDFFPVRLKYAELGDRSVSFGGTLSLDFNAMKRKDPNSRGDNSGGGNSGGGSGGTDNNGPGGGDDSEEDDPFNLSLSVDDIRFGLKNNNTFGFIGLKAEGEVGMPPEFIPGMDVGAYLRVAIETFQKIYELEGEVKFKVIEAHGLLTIRFTESNFPVIDNIEFSVGMEPGIPLIPPTVVAYITRLGGGIRDVYDTVTGNFYYLPPLKLVAIAGFDIAKVVKMDPARLEVSARGFLFDGELSIAGFEILEKVYASMEIADSKTKFAVAIKLGAEINVVDIIVGEVYASFSYDPDTRGIFGPVQLAGGGSVDVIIPKKVPMVGGKSVLGASAELGTERVYGEFRIIGIPVGVEYKWGSGSPTFILTDDAAYGLMQQKVTDEEGGKSGVLTFGSNIRLVSASERPAFGKSDRYAALAADYEYDVEIGDQDYALLELEFEGGVPNLEIYDPQGNLYELEEDVNYLVQEISADESQSGRLEQRVYVSIANPEQGEWRIESDQPLGVKLYDVEETPKLTNVDVAKKLDGTYDVTWTTAHGKGQERVALYLAPHGSQEYGQLLAYDIDAADGGANIELPESLQSGDYVVKAVLSSGGVNMHSMNSATVIQHANAHEPAQPTHAAAAPAGNGLLNVTWESASSPDGFLIELLDKNGNPLDAGEIVVDGEKREALIGGVIEDAEGNRSGLIPGSTYVIAITPYNEVNGVNVFGGTALTSAVHVPEPDPAVLEIDVTGDGVVRKGEDENGEYYLVNRLAANLEIASDQTADLELSVNDGAFEALPSGTSWQQAVELQEGTNMIRIAAVNEQGDLTAASVRIIADTTPPDLKIESPGTVHAAADGNVIVRGRTEPGAVVTVDGQPLAVDADGRFEQAVALDGRLSRRITIAAADEAGNRSEFVSHALNESVDGIERVEIVPAAKPVAVLAAAQAAAADNGMVEIGIGQTRTFELVGYDRKGHAFKIDPASVEWEFLLGSAYGAIADDGTLEALAEGEMVLKAAYALSNEYALEDTIIVKAVSDGPGGSDPVNYDDWYVPPSTGPGGGPGGVPGGGFPGGEDGGSPADIDKFLEDMLRSIIEAENGVEFLQAVPLKSGEEIVIRIGENVVLRIRPQPWEDGLGVGIGRVTDRQRFIYGTLEIIGDIYEFKTNKPVTFEQPPLLTIRFAMEDVADPDRAAIYWYNEQEARWEYIGRSYRPLESSVTAELPHFSKYALIYDEAMRVFADMAGRWSEDIIYRLASVGIVNGVERDGTYVFEPTRAVTRQEFAKLLAAVSGIPLTAAEVPDTFADRGEVGAWARPYMAAAVAKGWIAGTPDGERMKLEPLRSITRAEAAVMIARMLAGVLEPAESDAGFRDQDRIPAWAAPAVAQLKAAGVISGYPDGTFRPGDTITREESASMIRNIIDLLYNKGRTIP